MLSINISIKSLFTQTLFAKFLTSDSTNKTQYSRQQSHLLRPASNQPHLRYKPMREATETFESKSTFKC